MLKKNWLKEGLIFEYGKHFIIAEGPFQNSKFPHSSKICFYTPDFFSKKYIFQHSANIHTIQRDDLLSFLKREQKKAPTLKWILPNRREFKNQFEKFQNEKQLKKTVPIFFAQSNNVLNTQHRAWLLKNIVQKKEGFVYGIWTKNEGILGLTPEYLFKKNNQNIKTMALAGTGEHNLTSDPKEIEEHQIVVNSLSRGWKNIKHSPMHEWKFCGLKHLRTDIFIQTNLDFLSLIKKLHPTPALGGFPKRKALDWILKNESVPRKRFGAPFAVHFPNRKSFCLVAIRNIQWNKQHIFLGTGGGWIKKSKKEKEWHELELKRKSILNTLWRQ